MWQIIFLNATSDSCRVAKKQTNTKNETTKKTPTKTKKTVPAVLNYFRVMVPAQVSRYEPSFKGFDVVFFSLFRLNFSPSQQ